MAKQGSFEDVIVRIPFPEILQAIAQHQNDVVEASAGTGKTFTLEHLFIDLIVGASSHFATDGHVKPCVSSAAALSVDRILLMTFTQKAVFELRTRCHGKLVALVQLFDTARQKFRDSDDFQGSPEDGFCLVRHERAPNPFQFPNGERTFWNFGRVQRAQIQAALDNFDSADISTIHAFCQKTLREEAFQNQTAFEEKIVDENALFSRVFRNCLRKGLVTEDLLNLWEAPMISPKGRQSFPIQDRSLEQLLKAVVDHELQGDGLAGHVAEMLQAEVEQALREEKATKGLLTFDDMLLRLKNAVQQKPRIQANLGEKYGCILVDEFQDTDRTQWEILQNLKKTPHPPRLIVIGDPKQSIYRFRGADLSTYERAREELCDSGKPQRLDTNFRSSETLLDALNGLFDPDAFSEKSPGKQFVAEVITPVDSPEAVAGWKADELTSSGRTQRQLLKCRLPLKAGQRRQLVRESSDNDGNYALVREEDVKASNRYLTHGPYGSIWVKAGRPGLRFFPADRGESLSGAPLCIFQLTPKAANQNAIRCNLIAREIHLLTRPDSTARIETKSGQKRPVRKSDIFVLVRNKSLAAPLTETLEKLGIPYTFKSDSVFDGQAARDISAILRGVDDPYGKSAASLAALTPFFGMTLNTLSQLTSAAFQHQISEPLAAWKTLADRCQFGELFDSLMSASNGRRIFAGDARGLSDTAHIFDLLLQKIGARAMSLSEVIEVLDGWMAGRDASQGSDGDEESTAKAVRILDAPSTGNGSSSDDSVQILTMHTSKGLEAPVVFILEALQQSRLSKRVTQLPNGDCYVDDGGLHHRVLQTLDTLKKPPPMGDVFDDSPILDGAFGETCEDFFLFQDPQTQVAISRLADAERLIYVAMTRAQVRLYVFMTPSLTDEGEADGVTSSDWGQMNRRLELAVQTGEQLEPTDGFSTTSTQTSASESSLTGASSKLAAAQQKLACLKAYAAAIPDSTHPQLDTSRRTLVKTSYSRLAHGSSDQLRFLGGQSLQPRLVDAQDGHGPREEALSEVEFQEFAPSGSAESLQEAVDEPQKTDVAESLLSDCLPGGAEVGTFVHALFEKVPPTIVERAVSPEALAQSDAFQRAAQKALGDQGLELSEPQVNRSAELVWNALRAVIPGLVGSSHETGNCSEGACLLDLSDEVIHEVEFLFPIPEVGEGWIRSQETGLKITKGFVQGFIDGIFRGGDGRIWFLDWKTNRLEDGSIEGIRRCFDECYAIQAKLYAIALTRHLGISSEAEFQERFGGFAYVFVRNTRAGTSDGILSLRPTFDEVTTWMAELSGVDFTQKRGGR